MEYIKWTESLSVNIATFDLHHKKLIDEINTFYDNLGKKKNTVVISDALYSLKKYSIYHFDAEEAAMKKYGFYGYMQHKKEHNEFISKIDDLQNKLDNGKMVLALELANFLKEWLANHITVTDKAYSKFLTENGMK